jgi:hypothetical protein
MADPDSRKPGAGRTFTRAAAETTLVVLALFGFSMSSFLLGENYPMSPLSMFSAGLEGASRIVAKLDDGSACELGDFERFHCEGTVEFTASAQPQCSRIDHPENDRKAGDLVRARLGDVGEGGIPVAIVRRIFDVPNDGPYLVRDCVMIKCTALPKEGSCESIR